MTFLSEKLLIFFDKSKDPLSDLLHSESDYNAHVTDDQPLWLCQVTVAAIDF